MVRQLGWVVLVGLLGVAGSAVAEEPRVVVAADGAVLEGAVDGRVLVIFATDGEREPRFQVGGGLGSAQIFGVDVVGWKAGEKAVVDGGVFGYPVRSLGAVPRGEYWVQGVFQQYETFQPAHGHTVKLPMDQGEGRQWARAPGNLYSTPKKVVWDGTAVLSIQLDQVIPPVTAPEDTKYVRHVKIQSELLTEFWGATDVPGSPCAGARRV